MVPNNEMDLLPWGWKRKILDQTGLTLKKSKLPQVIFTTQISAKLY